MEQNILKTYYINSNTSRYPKGELVVGLRDGDWMGLNKDTHMLVMGGPDNVIQSVEVSNLDDGKRFLLIPLDHIEE